MWSGEDQVNIRWILVESQIFVWAWHWWTWNLSDINLLKILSHGSLGPEFPPLCGSLCKCIKCICVRSEWSYLSHLISPGPHKAFRNTRHQFVLIDSFIIQSLAHCEYYFAIEIISQQHHMTWLLDINTFELISATEQTHNECLVKASRGRGEK